MHKRRHSLSGYVILNPEGAVQIKVTSRWELLNKNRVRDVENYVDKVKFVVVFIY